LQIRALRPLHQEETDFILFCSVFLTLEEEGTTQPKRRAKRVKWPDVEARAKQIFGNRVMPNLVLLERDEAAF